MGWKKDRKLMRKQETKLARAIADKAVDEVQAANISRRRLKPKGLTRREKQD